MTFNPAQHLPGGFSYLDGTIDFYLRARSFLTPQSIVLDFGAGRAAWFDRPPYEIRRWVRHLTPEVKELVAVDVDAAVSQNRAATRTSVIQEGRVPLPDGYVDVVIADYVLEHIEDVQAFVSEISRVLKPGGMFCARTPHAFHYAALASRLLGNARQLKILAGAQPAREAKDIFPTVYRLNTLRAIHQAFPGWKSKSFIYPGDPGYFFGKEWLYRVFQAIHWATPTAFHGNLFVFLQKPKSA